MARARARRRRRNPQEQENLFAWTPRGGMGSHGQAAVMRISAARAPSAAAATSAGSRARPTKVKKLRARRVRRLGPIAKGQPRYMWVDASGNRIGGKQWGGFHRGGLTLGGKRKKAKAAPRKKGRKGKGRGMKKGRTAAQRAATRKMIAANRRRKGGKAKGRRFTSPALMRQIIGRMPKGRVTFKVKRRGKSKGYTVRSRGRKPTIRVYSRKQMRSALAGMPKGRVVIKVRGTKKRRGFTLRNPRGGSIMSRRNPRRRRRRNPGMDLMGTAKRTIAAAIPAVAGGAAMAIIDAKLLADRPIAIRVAAKVVAAAAAGVLLRSRPVTANLVMGAMLGSLGGELALRMSGGLMTPSKAATVQALGTLIREDPGAMSALIDATGAYSGQVPQMSGFESVADVNLG
jgi:hypothetical protein